MSALYPDRAEADLQALVDAGRGDVPLLRLRWRCSRCRSSRIDFVCTGRDALRVMPWSAHSDMAI